ncbi:MAG: phosphatase PAP2 family protein [Elusimicrobia bacterium]|nr:phosphatase PAP2 family protein [Elusimicrobiota bacterium]
MAALRALLPPAALLALGAAACVAPTRPVPPDEPPKIAEAPYYLTAGDVASLDVGPPAPIGSPQDLADMEAVREAQRTRTEADCERARAGAYPVNPAYAEFFGELGPLAVPLRGAERDLIVRVWSDLSLVAEGIKQRYAHPRPYAADAALEPCLKKTANPAFPSGHAACSRVFARVLGDLVPARRAEYLRRADEIARDRLVAGMHRPSEIEAGKLLGDRVHAALRASPKFRRDFAKIRSSLQR